MIGEDIRHKVSKRILESMTSDRCRITVKEFETTFKVSGRLCKDYCLVSQECTRIPDLERLSLLKQRLSIGHPITSQGIFDKLSEALDLEE